MIRINFVDFRGDHQTINAKVGLSLMEAAVRWGVAGIDADCGGACACATCHVYVDPAWQDALDPPAPTELEMLDFADKAGPSSRLACQVCLSEELDGLMVHLPRSQR